MAKKDMFDEVDLAEDQVQSRQGEELKINEEFAKRFEYNKKREERQKRECHILQSRHKAKTFWAAPSN